MSTTTLPKAETRLPKNEAQAEAHPAALVDVNLLAAADEHLATKAGARERAKAAHEVERQALEVALEASDLAVAGQGDPLKAALAVEEQSRRERVAARVLAHAADEHRRAAQDRARAGALALKPVHKAWRLRRLAAARAGDAADAAKAKAVAEYDEATAALRELTVAGLPDVHQALADPGVRTEADERAHWASRGIDDANPEHPWDPGRAA